MTTRVYPEEYLKEEKQIESEIDIPKTLYESIPSDDFSKLILLGIVATVCISGVVIVYLATKR